MTQHPNIESELTKIKAAAADIARLRASVLKELEASRQTRMEVKLYQQQVIARAQSEAQKLILHTRLALQKEVEETKRVTGQQMQKVLGGAYSGLPLRKSCAPSAPSPTPPG